MSVTKQLMDATDFHSIWFCQWGPSTVRLPTFFKMSSFVLFRRKKFRFETTWGWA